MKTKSLIETNPYLKDAAQRKKLVARSVRTSCGVEGIAAKGSQPRSKTRNHKKSRSVAK